MHAVMVQNLGKRLGEAWVVEGLSFTVDRGEVFGLLGPNGAGKTTTLRILAGLYAPDTGSAEIDGQRAATDEAGRQRLRGRVGLLTEQPGFYDRLPVRTNLVYFARLYGLTRADAEQRADRLLDRFALRAKAEQPFARLSRGMKQKLAIARAVLHAPPVVLLDEPTVGLDPEATREVRELIGELASEGRAIILCTHQLAEVERLCDRAAILARRLVGVHQVNGGEDGATLVISLASDPAAARVAVDGRPGVRAAELTDGGVRVTLDSAELIPELLRDLAAGGHRLTGAVRARQALEEAYVKLLAEARLAGVWS